MYLSLDLLRPRYWQHLRPGIWAVLIVVGHSFTAAIAAEPPAPSPVQAAQVNPDKSPLAIKIPEQRDHETVVVATGDVESTRVQGSERSGTVSDVMDWETVSTKASALLLDDQIPEIAVPDSLSQILSAQNSQDRVIAQTEAPAAATASSAALAQQSQNPIASLISLPFQNNTNFGVGAFNRTNNILNIQPVVPTPLTNNLTLVNRGIVPVSYQPELAPGVGNNFGLGDIIYQGYFVPKSSGNFTWGAGPVLLFPTATATSLGTGKWGAGIGLVGVFTKGRIVTGGLVNNIWSYAGDSSRPDVSLMTLQPFFNYNLDGGWYLNFGTGNGITADWLGRGEKWTVPIGGGFGRVFKIGRQPVNMSLRGTWNVVKPEGAADWTLQFSVTLLFPK